MSNLRIIFLWKAQMAAYSNPLFYFNSVNPFLNLKNQISFLHKTMKFYTKCVKSTNYGYYGPKSCNKAL